MFLNKKNSKTTKNLADYDESFNILIAICSIITHLNIICICECLQNYQKLQRQSEEHALWDCGILRQVDNSLRFGRICIFHPHLESKSYE